MGLIRKINYCHVMSAMASVLIVFMAASNLPRDDKWCFFIPLLYIAVGFFIASFDPEGYEAKADLIGLFWPILALMFIPGIIYLVLSIWREDRVIKKGSGQ